MIAFRISAVAHLSSKADEAMMQKSLFLFGEGLFQDLFDFGGLKPFSYKP